MIIPQPPAMPVHQFNAQDEAHLKLISVFHYVLGGLCLLGIGFLVLHFMIMSVVMRASEADMKSKQAAAAAVPAVIEAPAGMASPPVPPSVPVAPAPYGSGFPKEMMAMFIVFYVVAGVLMVAMCVGNVLSGIFIRKRKHRMFSFVIAGANCMQFPFGTALGVFTFIVLSRVSVKMDYEARLPA